MAEEDTTDQTYYDQVTGVALSEGTLTFKRRDGSTEEVVLFDALVAGLPTEDPEVAGALWNDEGTVMVSAGGA
jgi:hypothetical protein